MIHFRFASPAQIRGALRALGVAICAISLAAGAIAAPLAAVAFNPTVTEAAVDPDLYAAIQPRYRDEIRRAAGRLPVYRIAAEVEPANPERPLRIVGHLTLDYVHTDLEPQRAMVLRLYPNAPAYGAGSMTVSHLAVNGRSVATRVSVEDTVLHVPLDPPLAAGQAAKLALDFVTTVPVDSGAGFGIFSVTPATRSVLAGHWHPLLAGRDYDGWALDPVSRNGDVIFTDVALYDISLTVPNGLRPVVSGQEIARAPIAGATRHQYITGPARGAALALDDDWVPTELEIGGVRVVSYAAPDDAAGSIRIARDAAAALRIFGDRFGPYPYRTLSIVQMNLHGATGMEFPQMIAIGARLYDEPPGDEPRYAEMVVAHEIAHQWWFGLVGNNQYQNAFLDEGLAEFSAAYLYFRDRYGEEVAQTQMDREVRDWYLNRLSGPGDVTVASPTDAFPDRAAYAVAAYPKAALGFDAIRQHIGDVAFYAALRAYAADRQFTVAEPDDLRRAFADACRCAIASEWDHWFVEQNGADDFAQPDSNLPES
ncbi:MAG: M1 family metallopeptidase [Thermomicrobiales bacterium]|nr:M1 family metallopeptidase [Thermomicrobiales bacterium]